MATRPKPVVWSLSAQRELDEVLANVASDSLQGAQSIARGALAAAESLTLMSERGRMVPEVHDPQIQETFVYSYRLLYHVGDARITILAFIHGPRDFGRWRREER